MTNRTTLSRSVALASALTVLPTLANAHPGHEVSSFATGVLHPLTGMDHLLAMVAVGLWSVQLGGRALWAVPCAFVGVMSLGGLLGASGMSLPFVEQGILASVFVLGLMIVMATRASLAVSMSLVSVFALFHGFAHGAEMPGNFNGLGYGLGFAATTAVLHATGLVSGLGLRSAAQTAWIRAAGVAVLAGGLLISLT